MNEPFHYIRKDSRAVMEENNEKHVFFFNNLRFY